MHRACVPNVSAGWKVVVRFPNCIVEVGIGEPYQEGGDIYVVFFRCPSSPVLSQVPQPTLVVVAILSIFSTKLCPKNQLNLFA